MTHPFCVSRRCRQYNPNKVNTHKDKPAARNPSIPAVISWDDKLPLAEHPPTSEVDMEAACARFRAQMAEDGTAREDYGDDSMELMSNGEAGSAFEDFDGPSAVNGATGGSAGTTLHKTPVPRAKTKAGSMKKQKVTGKKAAGAKAKSKGTGKVRPKKSSVEEGDEEEWRAGGALVGRIDFGGGWGGMAAATTTPKKRRRSAQFTVMDSGSGEDDRDAGDDDPDWQG